MPSISVAIAAALIVCAPGCQPQVTQKVTTRRPHTPDTGAPADLTRAPVQNQRIRWEVLQTGSVPYDSMTLPLVSPDGTYIATQTGATPTWDQLLARDGAPPPVASRIEIYEIVYGRQSPRLVAAVDEPALLGRSVDRDGFLVESPRQDGSRWIGKVSWSAGTVVWLVADENVNAFASLGPDGRLAWSRRARDGEHFDLVVQHLAEPWIIESGSADWVMPMWSGRGDGLFVFKLANLFLDAVYGTASGPVEFQRSIRRLPIATDALLPAAYQMLNGHVNVIGGRRTPREELAFFHIGHGRVGLWQPRSTNANVATVFSQQSLFGVPDDAGFMIVMTEDALLRQQIDNPRDMVELLKGKQVPRPVANANWQYVLMSPGHSRVDLTALRLLPADAPLWTDASISR